MKRVHFLGQAKVELRDVPAPNLAEGRVLVRIRCSALCGSELGAYRNAGMNGNPGHEAVGLVEEGGEKFGFAKGTRVGLHAVWGCGKCQACAEGKYTWCESRIGIGQDFHSELALVPAQALFRPPENLTDAEAVLVSGDGLGVCYHMAKRLQVKPNAFVVVLGLGPVGLGHVMLQAFLGARVIGLDVSPERLAFAKDLGAQSVLDVRTVDVVKAVKDLTGGQMAQVVVEATGRPECVKQAFSMVAHGGTIAQSGECGSVTVSPSEDLIRRDVGWVGGWYFFFNESTEMVDLVRKGLQPGRLVTHALPFKDAAQAFALFAGGKTGKVLLTNA
ncbi:MAG: zinc-binding dehydrogenase [Planctomycetes bacterium]|nr:zinc-binding dehydrogenase [Planctomycetota bacterium]